MFLRLPALRDLDPDDRRLLIRTIGGHPRLIEFTDALLRGGRSDLRHVQRKLRDLARQGIDLATDVPWNSALNQAMLLGSADILLTELLALLTPRQAADPAPDRRLPRPDDPRRPVFRPHHRALPSTAQADLADLQADVNRLTDLTLLNPARTSRCTPGRPILSPATPRPTHRAARAGAGHAASAASSRTAAATTTSSTSRATWLPWAATTTSPTVASKPLSPARHPGHRRLPRRDPPSSRKPSAPGSSSPTWRSRPCSVPATSRRHTALQRHPSAIQARAAADPANTEWQRDLSVSHNKLGDLAIAAGDLTAARTAYHAGLDIRQRLAAADPANTDGSATCPSATTSSATWRWPPGT